jgi:AcrR family transcriptional regulator
MADRESRKNQIITKRQDQILKAALDTFAQEGYTSATIPEIAKSAGVAVGTIYIYYPNKRELFISVIENLLITPLLNMFEKEPWNEFPSTVKEALHNRLQILQSDLLSKLLVLIGEIKRDPELKTLFSQNLLQPFFVKMERMFRSRINPGEFRRIEPAIIVRLIGSMIIGIILIKDLEGSSSPLNLVSQEKLADEIMDFIFHGIMSGEGD